MSKSNLLTVLFILCLLLQTNASYGRDNLGAVLLVTKNIVNEYLVVNMDISINYTLYNAGRRDAYNVTLMDEDLLSNKVRLKEGSRQHHFEKIQPYKNATCHSTIEVTEIGRIRFNSSIIYYNIREGKIQKSLSTEPGERVIISQKEYYKKYASKYKEWIKFNLFASIPIIVPFGLWYKSKKKYEALENSCKKRPKQQ